MVRLADVAPMECRAPSGGCFGHTWVEMVNMFMHLQRHAKRYAGKQRQPAQMSNQEHV